MVNDVDYYRQMEAELEKANNQTQQLQQHYASTMFSAENNDNLVKWQLDIKEELARIEHLIRKHIPATDQDGNEYYKEAPKENQIFNETGVNEILNLLAWYLNKNIILSNFNEKQINQRCEQLGEELINFVFNNYENFGLNDKEKIKHFPIVVMNILNTIEAAYNRAWRGGERESLRTARTVIQSENSRGGQQMLMPQQQRKFSLVKPTTWF